MLLSGVRDVGGIYFSDGWLVGTGGTWEERKGIVMGIAPVPGKWEEMAKNKGVGCAGVRTIMLE